MAGSYRCPSRVSTVRAGTSCGPHRVAVVLAFAALAGCGPGADDSAPLDQSTAALATWGTFQRDMCTYMGKRQYSSILWNIPWGADWTTTCRNTSGTPVGGVTMLPSRCVQNTNMWGEFDVSDSSCNPYFDVPKRDQCVSTTQRQYSAVIRNLGRLTSASTACPATSATINGITKRPDRCKADAVGQWWGEFDIADTSCQPYFDPLKADACRSRTLRQFSAVLRNVPPGASLSTTCFATATFFNGAFLYPTRCTPDAFGQMWGEWDVADSSCQPYWGEDKQDHCIDETHRQYSSVLWNIPPDETWESACLNTPNDIGGTAFSASACKNLGQMWGEFSVPDDSCKPHWGWPKRDECAADGIRRTSAWLLDMPQGTPGEVVCPRTPREMCDGTSQVPARCEYVFGSWWGIWFQPDESCRTSPVVSAPTFSAAQHEEIYKSLRAKLIARHFAVGRHFRANLLALMNVLNPSTRPPSLEKNIIDPWDVETHDRDNPHLYGSQLFTALAVEHHFGHPRSAQIIASGLRTMDSLYPFRDRADPVSGWMVRSDPVTSDLWRLDDGGLPLVAEQFYAAPGGGYQFTVPSSDPRTMPFRLDSTLTSLLAGVTPADGGSPVAGYDAGRNGDSGERIHRFWELSMDEVAGLAATYSIVNDLVAPTDPQVASLLRPQAARLGRYLADNGYLMVRPFVGGFSSRGGTGWLPAMEYPIARALGRVSPSESFASRLSFEDGLRRAGTYDSVSGQMMLRGGLVQAGSLLVDSWVGAPRVLDTALAIGSAGVFPELFGTAATEAQLYVSDYDLGAAWALYDQREAFDVADDAAASEAALAYVATRVPYADLRFRAWLASFRVHWFECAPKSGWSENFPPFLALTSAVASDPVLSSAYVDAFRNGRQFVPMPDDVEDANAHRRMNSAFATAVAVLNGAREFETLLKEKLDARAAVFSANLNDVPITDAGNGFQKQDAALALDYVAALSLAWLHAERMALQGTPVTVPGFPVPPTSFASWPTPSVPEVVLDNLPEVKRAFLGTRSSVPPECVLPPESCNAFGFTCVDAFCPSLDLEKPAIPAPVLPPMPATLVFDGQIDVPESSGDVLVPLPGGGVQWGDAVQIDEVTGQVQVNWLAGWVNANGKPEIVRDLSFPLHGALDPVNAREGALLFRLGGWSFVGTGFGKRQHLGAPMPLFLRVNDNHPGDGSGGFRARVRLFRN